MDHICVLVHGIEADPAFRLWNEEVETRYQKITPIRLISRKYGFVRGFSVWASAFARKEAVDHEEAYFRGVYGEREGLFESLEPGTRVSIVGHSLGGYITTALLKRGVKFHRIAHLWGSSVESFDWHKVDDCFDRARVYWSPIDEVLKVSSVAVGEDPELALGLMGKLGPTIAHPRVEPICLPWTHTQFMDCTAERDEFWKDLFGWMED